MFIFVVVVVGVVVFLNVSLRSYSIIGRPSTTERDILT